MHSSFHIPLRFTVLAALALVLLVVTRDALATGAVIFVPLVRMPRVR